MLKVLHEMPYTVTDDVMKAYLRASFIGLTAILCKGFDLGFSSFIFEEMEAFSNHVIILRCFKLRCYPYGISLHACLCYLIKI